MQGQANSVFLVTKSDLDRTRLVPLFFLSSLIGRFDSLTYEA